MWYQRRWPLPRDSPSVRGAISLIGPHAGGACMVIRLIATPHTPAPSEVPGFSGKQHIARPGREVEMITFLYIMFGILLVGALVVAIQAWLRDTRSPQAQYRRRIEDGGPGGDRRDIEEGGV